VSENIIHNFIINALWISFTQNYLNKHPSQGLEIRIREDNIKVNFIICVFNHILSKDYQIIFVCFFGYFDILFGRNLISDMSDHNHFQKLKPLPKNI
jgi:hypothetical protein